MMINISFEKDLSIRLVLLSLGLAKFLLLVQTTMSIWDLITRIKDNLKMVLYVKSKEFSMEGRRNCAITIHVCKNAFHFIISRLAYL